MSTRQFLGGEEAPPRDAAAGESDDSVRLTRRDRIRESTVAINLCRILVVLFLLAIWEVASSTFVDPFWISKPSDIFPKIWDWATTGFLWTNLAFTLEEALLGLLAGSVCGIALGLVLGHTPFVSALLQPIVSALYSMPRIALAPLFVLWFGIGIAPKVLLVAFIVFFLTFGNTYAGVRAVDRDLVDVLRVMGANRSEIVRKVVLPSSLNWIFVGLRLSAPYSIVGAVTGEFVASTQGIGYVLRAAAGVFDTTSVFAGLVVLMIVGFVVDQLLVLAERRQGRWRDTEVR